MKTFIISLILIILIGGGIYFVSQNTGEPVQNPDLENLENTTATTTDSTATTTAIKTETVLGNSVQGNPITAYHFGNLENPDTEVLFVGGIHGGYEWNTVLVAYEIMDYLKESTSTIPANVKATVIPVLNPDGLNKVVGSTGRFEQSDVPSEKDATVPGRFNGNNVDLNRNFDCDWKADGKWQDKTVSGGTSAFSEPESKAVRDYIEKNKPEAVVVYYSAAGGVYASNCHDETVLPETQKLTDLYAKVSGYPAYKSFNFYEITGDMVNWLAKIDIPAISVLLTTHTDTEWTKNQKGVEAVLKNYAKNE